MLESATRGVRRTVLDNGLRVLVKEDRATEVAAVYAHVNVGYFNEPDRWNGIAHVVEHMFFKGTRTRPAKEQIAEDVRAIGGSINAGTYYDETSYYIVAPGSNVERAIEIQADTFTGSLFDAAELAKEIEVIIQESKQKRDNPGAMALETMYAEAYDTHRIRRWRIGHDETLRALRREDLVDFVEWTYRPCNIVVAIVGNVEYERVLDQLHGCWGAMPRGELRREESPDEPPRRGFRFRRIRADIQQRLVEVGFPAPPVLHADSPALTVLGALLTDGRSARLYRSLKEDQRLVNSAWAGYEGFERLGLFTLGLEVIADDPLAAEQALIREMRRAALTPAGDDELRRVKTRIESRRVFAQEEVLGMARNLASYEALGDYRIADEMIAKLQAVTADDIQRVASDYLPLDAATLLEYLPATAEAPERTAESLASELAGAASSAEPAAAAAPARSVAERGPEPAVAIDLARGGTLLYRRRSDLPVVAIHVLFPGGRAGESAANAGITNLMLRSSLKGTDRYSAVEIADRVESLGSSIGLPYGADYFGFAIKLLADRVEEGTDVLREVISQPTFPDDEVDKEKEAIYGEIRRTQDSMTARAMELFGAAYYGRHAYGLPNAGVAEAIARLGPADLRHWHGTWVGAQRALIAVVGDISAERATAMAEGLVPDGMTEPYRQDNYVAAGPAESVAQVERQQTASVMGFTGANAGSDDRFALDLLAEITSGLAGRFFQAVRGDNALAYAVSSFHRARMAAGTFLTYTATSPEREDDARKIVLAECRRLAREPVGERELADAKEALRGEQKIALQTFGAQAAELAVARLYGRPLDAPERYMARVGAITAAELRDATERYLTPDRYWLGVVRGIS